MNNLTLPLPGLSPVAGRTVKACFDGGAVSWDAGVLVLREVENGLDVGERLAGRLADPRDPARIEVTQAIWTGWLIGFPA